MACSRTRRNTSVSAPWSCSSSAGGIILFWAIVGLLVWVRASKRTPRWPSLSTSSAALGSPRIYTTLRDITEPSWRASPPTAYPNRPSGVQSEAPTGTLYSDSQRRGHHEAGEGTRVGTPLGLDLRLNGRRLRARSTSGDRTLVWSNAGSLGAHSLRPRETLFTQQACALRAASVADDDVAEICRRLRRLALARELAPVRVKALRVEASATRIRSRARFRPWNR